MDPWVVEVVRYWLPHSLPQRNSTIQGSHPYAILPPLVHQRGGAWGGHSGSDRQECCGACSTSLPRLLQPSLLGVEDLGVLETRHRYLDPQSLRGRVTFQDRDHPVCSPVCSSGRLDGLHRSQRGVPTDSCPPESRRFLRFVAHGQVYQFTALCFGLSKASQVFSRVMAPVSAILHSWGIRMRRYLDDWLVQSSSRDSLIHDLQVVLGLCRELGIVVNPEKSLLKPSQVVQYLGVLIDAQSFKASPSPDRIARLQSTAGEFLSFADPSASIWLSLLGMLSSLSHLVPGVCLRVRSLQLYLHRSWD